ncbi:hypothetical protein D3C87_957960 [compost metagenome]
MTVRIFGPVGNIGPGGGFVRLGDPLLDRNRAEGAAHVTDIGGGIGLLGGELGDLLGRAHVGILMLDAVDAAQLLPGILPVGPAVGHADAVKLAFATGGLFEIRDIFGGKQRLTDGHQGQCTCDHAFHHPIPLD